ncbi:MAG: mechanosensitive ion channel [Chitinophagaceae bacterium]|nr:mechanosensitive ion channel [Chitinophagaceae bacterium]
MNDFLQKIWLYNTIQTYLIVVGVILFIWAFKKLISRYFAGLLFSVVKKIWKDVDKQSFVSLVVKPLGTFLAILASLVALFKLNFPGQLNTEILFGYTSRAITYMLGVATLIISFAALLIRLIDFIAIILERKANLTPEQNDNQLIVFFKDFFKVIIVIISIIMVLRYAFGQDVRSLLTGLSIVGAAIALALRESLENLIASFIIFFDKPFVTGDLVKVLNVTGTVERIGLRSTRIRTEQKTFVTVPNKQMVDSILDNLSLRTHRKGDLRLEIDLHTSSELTAQLIERVKKILSRADVETSQVHLAEIAVNAIVVTGDYFTAPLSMDEFNVIRQEINLQSLKLLEELNIELAGENKDIKINK